MGLHGGGMDLALGRNQELLLLRARASDRSITCRHDSFIYLAPESSHAIN
jgi:hypothetical protein